MIYVLCIEVTYQNYLKDHLNSQFLKTLLFNICLKVVPEAAIKKGPHFASQYITIIKAVFLHYFPMNIKPDFAS